MEIAALEGHSKYTTFYFLKIIDNLNTVLIQNVAAMAIKLLECQNHLLYHLKVFRSAELQLCTKFVMEIRWIFSGFFGGFWLNF